MALLNLVAYGAQDVYLTGDPTTMFFSDVYRNWYNNNNNFSSEHREDSLPSYEEFASALNELPPAYYVPNESPPTYYEHIVPTDSPPSYEGRIHFDDLD